MQVADGTVHAILRRCVLVRLHLQAQRFGPLLRAPALRERQEEALLGREAVAFVRGVSDRDPEGIPRDLEAAEVGDVLAERQLAVDVEIVDRHVRIELLDELGGARIEVLAILAGPPVAKIALGVEAAALIVEAVQHLVADHGADAAVVQRVVGGRVEVGRLHLRGREHDLVLQRVVIRVDRLRQHAPFGLVDRLADLRELAMRLERDRGEHVVEIRAALDREIE